MRKVDVKPGRRGFGRCRGASGRGGMQSAARLPSSLPHDPTDAPGTIRLAHLRHKIRELKLRLDRLNAQDGRAARDARGVGIVAVVDREKCRGCGICREACPRGAVRLEAAAHIDPKRCTGCGLCIDRCPQGAIALIENGLQYNDRAAI